MTNNLMSPQPTRVVTGEVRFSYVNLLKPQESQFGGEPKYRVTILLPKSDTVTKAKIDAAIEAAKQAGKNKWNGVIPPMVALPIHDGDGVKPSDGTPYGEECKGHWVFSASAGVNHPPEIIDVNGNNIIDPTEVYSGMYGRIALNFAPYANAGKKGIGCYISKNVQKTRDGEPLGASAPAAVDDFGINPANQMPMFDQNIGHPASAPYGNSQPGAWSPQQQPPIPPVGQNAPFGNPSVDPITGQPYGGYGV